MAITTEKPLVFSVHEIMEWERKDLNKRKIELLKYQANGAEAKEEVDEFFVVRPNLALINIIACYNKEGKLEKAQEVMINSCVLAGNMEKLKYDDQLLLGLLSDLGDMIEVKKRIY